LPEGLAIHGVILIKDRAVKSGGFADIYHGRYTNAGGDQVEVALKVLRIFQNYSESTGRRVIQKFVKEAIVWRYLKHPNILPFLGVDGTTFPAPRMAMVSPWMPQGSVLNYVSENSPASCYAINLLDDVIQGLKYLHSANIAHGDLCGRNILINERRAYLTDFGLAGFVQSETSAKTSTHGGSMRWSAPELIHPNIHQPELPFKRTPASDVWAFGCVCCEIWTEGEIPFARMSEGTLILALSRLDADDVVPYDTKPCDKAGTPLSDALWELVQSCFKHKASARPDVSAIA
ncbi:kinase-like domain-containing protein, partial [Mycena leptocephala]